MFQGFFPNLYVPIFLLNLCNNWLVLPFQLAVSKVICSGWNEGVAQLKRRRGSLCRAVEQSTFKLHSFMQQPSFSVPPFFLDWTGHRFWALKSDDRRILCCSETSIGWFGGLVSNKILGQVALQQSLFLFLSSSSCRWVKTTCLPDGKTWPTTSGWTRTWARKRSRRSTPSRCRFRARPPPPSIYRGRQPIRWHKKK